MRLTDTLRLVFLTLVFLGSTPAHAVHFRLALNDDDDRYVVDIFALALKAEGGHNTFETIPRILLNQTEALKRLDSPNRRYDVHYSGYTPERAKAYAMVPFPITRGMLGHRLLAVTAENRELFADVQTLADFRAKAILCSGTDWPDTDILRAAGLRVVVAGDSSLWPLLARGRVNAFPRGINEIIPQIEQEGHGKYGVRLVIEPHLMLQYRFDLFFFLSQKDAAKAAILTRGLEAAYKSGELDRLLQSDPDFADILADLKQHPRTVIELHNPDMDSSKTGIPDEDWRIYR